MLRRLANHGLLQLGGFIVWARGWSEPWSWKCVTAPQNKTSDLQASVKMPPTILHGLLPLLLLPDNPRQRILDTGT